MNKGHTHTVLTHRDHGAALRVDKICMVTYRLRAEVRYVKLGMEEAIAAYYGIKMGNTCLALSHQY